MIEFQDTGHFELEFELKIENFNGSLTAEANPELKVELLHFVPDTRDTNQTGNAEQSQRKKRSPSVMTESPIYIAGTLSYFQI